MFSLKEHARKNARLVVIGAAASASLLAADAQAAVTFFWDPGNSQSIPGSGGTGTFDNTNTNFFNGTPPDVAATSSSNVDFSNTGGSVTVDAPTTINTLTLDVGGYTFTGSAITLNAGSGANLVTQNAGNNVISAPLLVPNGGSSTTQTWNITGNLTLGNVTQANLPTGGYCSFLKSGTGSLIFTGTLSAFKSDGLNVSAGLVSLQGTANILGHSLTVATTATITGNASSKFEAASNTVNINGHLAPGANTAGNFGGTGTFALMPDPFGTHSMVANLNSTSNLDLDLTDLTHFDSLAFTAGSYTGGTLAVNIDPAATVNINNGTGSLVPGTYQIVTLQRNTVSGQGGSTAITLTDSPTANGVGFVIGNAPAGYTYTFSNFTSGSGATLAEGVDLVVTASAVPEPASLALLGLGAGILFTRKRRGRQS